MEVLSCAEPNPEVIRIFKAGVCLMTQIQFAQAMARYNTEMEKFYKQVWLWALLGFVSGLLLGVSMLL
jgi:hypothetical protein